MVKITLRSRITLKVAKSIKVQLRMWDKTLEQTVTNAFVPGPKNRQRNKS